MKVGRGELMYERISVGKAVVEKQLLCTQSARKLLILKCSLLTTLKEVVSVVVLVFGSISTMTLLTWGEMDSILIVWLQ